MPHFLLPAALLKAYDDKQADVVQRLLSRLLQYGHFDIAGVQLALEVLHVDIKSKDERALTRLVHYLVHLGLGDGSAGTPLPVPVASGGAGDWRGLTPGFGLQLGRLAGCQA